MVISSKIKTLKCSSCNKPIPPYERLVQFPCPNCGETIIIRCYKCRKLINSYTCIKCGFKGP